MVKEGVHIITKLRWDANPRYLYQGQQKKGKGRPKLHAGKVDVKALDKGKVPLCYWDKEVAVYIGILYAVQFKRKVLVAFVFYKGKTKPKIIISTDLNMDGLLMCRYYGLRFQVEFLILDVKQRSGLEDCQAR